MKRLLILLIGAYVIGEAVLKTDRLTSLGRGYGE